MKIMPEVSIVMAVYNEEIRVHLAIESILNQTFTDFEFIVIDDGSTDDTQAVLTKYSGIDKRIKVIRQENHGLTKALNKGLCVATGKYIARQDDNDISLAERLARQVSYLESHPTVVLVGSDIDVIDDDGAFLVTNCNSHVKNLGKKCCKVNPFCHGSIMFRRKVGGVAIRYNDFYRKAQDYDLVCRLVELGSAVILPEVLYQWRFSKNGIVATNVNFYGERARINYICRINGFKEDFSQPSEKQITPDYSEWRFTWALAIRYLSGYDTSRARRCFFDILKKLPFMGTEYRLCLKYIAITFLPITVIRMFRER